MDWYELDGWMNALYMHMHEVVTFTGAKTKT